MDEPSGWDIIGDVHGHCGKLYMLLPCLGYEKLSGTWHHPEGRKIIFLGDLIDRGSEQIQTVELVRGMVEAGEALCIMGNHEFNAIQYQLGYRNLKEGMDPHDVFLDQVPKGSLVYKECLDWFRTLPLWLEFQDFCVIHACWDEAKMQVLRDNGLGKNAVMNERLHTLSGEWYLHNRGSAEVFDALESLIKGPEIHLPEGYKFSDKDGCPRSKIRIRWWMEYANTYRDFAFMDDVSLIPEIELPQYERERIVRLKKPVFIGHYWLHPKAAKEPLSSMLACLDYSAGKGGPLVAYRWNSGDRALCASRFVVAGLN